MRIEMFIAAVFAFAAWVQGVRGQEEAHPNVEPPTPIVFAERHQVASEALGETRQVEIRLPESYSQTAPSRIYPVVFVLDGELLFEPVAATVSHLGSVGRMPEAIVVGLPNHTGDRLGLSPKFLDRDGNPSSFGGREEFYLEFLRDELLPYLDARFRTADFRILFGVSPTAAFALHSFWRAPDLFQGYAAMVAGSLPDKVYTNHESLTNAIEASLRENPDRKAWLYLSSAESNVREREEIGASLKNLERRLQPFRARGLSLLTEVVPGAAYATVLPAITSALDLIFPAETWDPSYVSFLREEGPALKNLESRFSALSASYGFPVVPLGDRFFNVNCLRGLGSRLRREGRSEEAVQVLRHWVELYPSAPDAHFHLAYALHAAKEPDEALAASRQGLELARELSSSDLDQYEELFRSLEERILADRGDETSNP